jgi:hypothetical protein
MCLEAVTLILKLSIFNLVFQATSKKESWTMLTFNFIMFNPISMWSGNSHANIGAFNDMIFYLIVWMTIHTTRGTAPFNNILLQCLNVIFVYFDFRNIFLVMIFSALQLECFKSDLKVGTMPQHIFEIAKQVGI